MLRWLIAVLFLANMLAFVVMRGTFGPLPAAGPREPGHLAQQVRPDALRVTALAQAADQPVVGGPIEQPNLDAEPLDAASAAAPASAPGAASAAAPASAAPG
ncbi:hypothetical protein Bsp3421_005664 [Burkholderia sp. FERM BP-3421]|jgi:hypothetical protein|uniref:hypothetical protein n=1 Tax=Burkholderia sp. FERM BP-3421 TaxID=1494466 RepID=UPI00235F4CF9|nr:hypothetical protein [Burkholderia sp. FERM BP-3421]WDD95488.1 hypothetical protein Bsp3421_005664 [Burkholderia sp. FERM BP-3421]